MDFNSEIKQETFDEGEMLIEPPKATPMNLNNLKRANESSNESHIYTPNKRPCFYNYSPLELYNLEQVLLQKSHTRGDVPTIYNPPFYELQIPRPEYADKVVARCCSCNVLLRGSKSITSNFIKHMKNSHPKIYVIYQRIKTLKSNRKGEGPQGNKYPKTEYVQPFEMPVMTTMMTSSSNGASCDPEQSENTEFSATQSNYSNEEELVDADYNGEQSSYNPLQTHQQPQQLQHHSSSNGNDISDLSFQMLNAMSSLLDEKLKGFATKEQFEDVKRTITESLNQSGDAKAISSDSKVSALQAQVVKLEKERDDLRSTLKQMQQSKRQMQINLQTIDRKLNHCKLIIKNIKIENNANPHEIVEKLLTEQLKLTNIAINKVELAPKKNNKIASSLQHLFVELKHERDLNEILKHSHKLKKSGIRIEPQKTQCLRKQQLKLIILRKEILKRKSDAKTRIRDTELIVEGIKFYWDDVDGLSVGSYAVKDMNAISCLQRLTNNDFTEFINFLKRYDVRVEK